MRGGDREAACQSAQLRRYHDTFEKLEHRTDTVSIGPQKQDPGVAPGGIGSEVREAFVSGDEEPALFLDGPPEGRIFPAAHSLLADSSDLFIAGLLEEGDDGTGEIFVDLEAQRSPSSSGQRQETLLMQDFRCIGQRGEDIRGLELGILRHDLFDSQAVRQTSYEHPHRDTGAFDAGFPMMDLGIGGHSLLPGGAFHGQSLPQTRPIPGATTS
jgi:hypothetical protein